MSPTIRQLGCAQPVVQRFVQPLRLRDTFVNRVVVPVRGPHRLVREGADRGGVQVEKLREFGEESVIRRGQRVIAAGVPERARDAAYVQGDVPQGVQRWLVPLRRVLLTT